ncbi:tyrosine-protein phosphatase non-receptor type 18 isoform X5 [Cyclopterus lumpus]|uniref:tyrosine-protein phosphatase non-receptor type 18 isoform X5 n=1 Tax=Cyclopterus lumpus TaxID=8103 RepID=UPI0014860280|nr:tyrosine-protein phosphatase non-receptor type 18 isoform X5 [Cyclopterus lumpus]
MERISSLLSSLRTLETGTLDQEYNMVRSQTSLLKRDLSLTTEAGALKENMKKNRYKDILPYDQSRVVLSLLTSDSDYINASFIQKKCECYWSPLHQSASFGPFTVCNEKLHPDEDVVVRALKVSFQQDSRSVTQYQFLSWPDHDVPFEASGVLDLLERVRESRGADTSPLLVHCSAGCGRTGVICALDYIHDLLVNEHSDFSIMQIVKEIRRQRPSAVQTKEQYRFIFTAAAAMLERELLCCNTSEVKTHNGSRGERKRPTPSSKRQQIAMNDTYAVVNKPKHPPSDPASSAVDTPRFSRTPPPSHHYDNDPSRASAAPVYSAVKPRAKPHGSPLSATPLYDMPANHRLGDSGEHHLSPAGGLSLTDDDYEDFCPSAPDASGRGSPGGIGFNCRIQKPRGPRDPPADWRDELV